MGVTDKGDLGQRFGWQVDVAGVPGAHTKIERLESNRACGVEADAMMNVDLTPNWRLVVGGRCRWLKSNVDRRYAATGETVVFDHNDHRYGLLLERSCSF